MILSSYNHARRGFSLAELAIVLGIVGVVVGAIWATSSVIGGKSRTNDMIMSATEISDNVRAMYKANPIPANVPTSTADQIDIGLIPDSLVHDTNEATSPMGGEIGIAFKRSNKLILGFTVGLGMDDGQDLQQRNQACWDMITRLQGSGRSSSEFDMVNDLPVAKNHPLDAEDRTTGQGPIFVYAKLSTGSSFANVTNMQLDDYLSALGSDGCLGVAYYFLL